MVALSGTSKRPSTPGNTLLMSSIDILAIDASSFYPKFAGTKNCITKVEHISHMYTERRSPYPSVGYTYF